MIDRRSFHRGYGGGRARWRRRITRVFAAGCRRRHRRSWQTTAGKIRGTQAAGVYAFKGVPYGATHGRRGPFPAAGEAETLDRRSRGHRAGRRSPQLLSLFHGVVPPEVEAMDRDETMGEDCLVLNVWTPTLERGRKLPVMVWLHGGGFTSGSGGFICYDGTQLAKKHDVVVVTVNHRLSALGYLYLAGLGSERYANSSNVGNLDIVAALEWVRDNIATFGADPGNVTHIWPVRRRRQGQLADGHARGARAVQAGDRAKRRLGEGHFARCREPRMPSGIWRA